MPILTTGLLLLLLHQASPPWPVATESTPLVERIVPPEGYRRLPQANGTFGHWLRHLPLRPPNTPVRYFDGRRKGGPVVHVAVIDIDVGRRDLQQCADAVIRLRAEYLRSRSCQDAITFDFTSGDEARWSDWKAGLRPRVDGHHVRWEPRAAPDGSYGSFRSYLDTVFTYAGSASLERELEPVGDPARVLPGDVFIQGGFPGHAVLVLDVAENDQGRRVFLLGQSYMPAQDLHVLRGEDGEPSPWYRAWNDGELRTPEWTFRHRDLRRFSAVDCH